MSRLLLLSILVLWMCPRDNVRPLLDAGPAAVLFLGAYALLVIGMSLWSRVLARRVADDFLGRTLDRYNRTMELARYFIPAWFAAGIFALGWGKIVYDLLSFTEPSLPHQADARWLSETYWRIPGLLVGTAPPLLAWMGLWWAQYPADRALKEQSVLFRVNEGLPVRSPPPLATFFVEHFRQQVLFTLAPVVLIVAARDVLALGWLAFADHPLPRDGGEWIAVPLAILIFILAPEILRRIIPTRPLPPDWPLRQRLDALCQRAGLRCRDILLWHTNGSVGNAMVMGLFPRVRYIFLSDLLLETMRDEEIEAVFAHEIGHIVHRHMWWYMAFVAILMLLIAGPIALLMAEIPVLNRNADLQAQIATVLGLGFFAVIFGYFSRRFERQADVFAARTMEATRARPLIRHSNPEAALIQPATLQMPAVTLEPVSFASASAAVVGDYGASVVASALHRVARVNNIPISAHEWLHGSIQHRMEYLHALSDNQGLIHGFDRSMRRLYWMIAGSLVGLAAWFCFQYGLTGIAGSTF